jgi:hypothetical protein
VVQLGRELFGPHLLAVEVGGTLLLAALIGAAVIVARGKLPVSEPARLPTKDERGADHG